MAQCVLVVKRIIPEIKLPGFKSQLRQLLGVSIRHTWNRASPLESVVEDSDGDDQYTIPQENVAHVMLIKIE